eukprot:scaffold171542_cov22-Tisochrysis_lutea.AAC.1
MSQKQFWARANDAEREPRSADLLRPASNLSTLSSASFHRINFDCGGGDPMPLPLAPALRLLVLCPSILSSSPIRRFPNEVNTGGHWRKE